MKIINQHELAEDTHASPGGTFGSVSRYISEALGRQPESTDLALRHPFDIEHVRIPRGLRNWPYHSHSAQWEFFYVLSGSGSVRHAEGTNAIRAGDAFLFKPGEAHQLIAGDNADLEFLIVADNPFGETTFFPDSGKWTVRSPEKRMIRSQPLDYYDGEE